MLGLRLVLASLTGAVAADGSRFGSGCERDLPSFCHYERRRSRRQETELIVLATAADGAVYRGYSRDVSDQGTAVHIWGELAVGSPVTLAVRVGEGGETIRMACVVRNRTGFRYGLEFSSRDSMAEHDNDVGRLLAVAPAIA